MIFFKDEQFSGLSGLGIYVMLVLQYLVQSWSCDVSKECLLRAQSRKLLSPFSRYTHIGGFHLRPGYELLITAPLATVSVWQEAHLD